MVWNEGKGERQKRKGFWITCLGACFFTLGAVCAHAQTFAEWFSQKKTQIRYLKQQIAALQQYGGIVKQGYRIAQDGWDGIGHGVKGEFDLHSAYYNSLKTVNPAIKNDPKADSIVTLAELIPRQFDHLNGLSGSDADTKSYIGRVKTAVLTETDKDLSEWQFVMTDGQAQLTDDERIKRLDGIDERIREKLVFSTSFCNAVRMFIIQHHNSLNDLEIVRRLYGIN
ncbi:hypothetical protein [Mucilaginibacter sp. SG564]|uniref:hypothetical protein n=1 Tax=Mucilaginibacter sp. SG564 TaxID=2587022 RepID=UPI0015581296|nr:hypothetical protein [Mucilaginibacter sp. SG564]NOW95851.1 hypothetical protein [Mucilaginibacter sp. SG564]